MRKMKVSLAAQVFSQKVSSSMRSLARYGIPTFYLFTRYLFLFLFVFPRCCNEFAITPDPPLHGIFLHDFVLLSTFSSCKRRVRCTRYMNFI